MNSPTFVTRRRVLRRFELNMESIDEVCEFLSLKEELQKIILHKLNWCAQIDAHEYPLYRETLVFGTLIVPDVYPHMASRPVLFVPLDFLLALETSFPASARHRSPLFAQA